MLVLLLVECLVRLHMSARLLLLLLTKFQSSLQVLDPLLLVVNLVFSPVVAGHQLRMRVQRLPVAFVLWALQKFPNLIVLLLKPCNMLVNKLLIHLEGLVPLSQSRAVLPETFPLLLLQSLFHCNRREQTFLLGRALHKRSLSRID